MTTSCPGCKKQLKETDKYFCTNCGEELSDRISVSEPTYAFKVTKFAPKESKLNFKPLISLGSLVVSLILLFFLIKFGLTLLPSKKSVSLLPQTGNQGTVSSVNEVKTTINAAKYKFSNQSLITNVPDNVDFYLEGGDFSSFYKLFISDYTEKPFVDNLLSVIGNEFIIAGKKVDDNWELGLYLRVKSQEELLDILDNLDADSWRVVLVRDTIIISNSEKLIEDSISASNGITKNLGQNSKFVTKSSQLKDTGQLLYLTVSDINTPYDLAKLYNASGQIQDIINEVKSSGYDKFVLTNE